MTFNDEMDAFTGEQRAKALYYYFGWQGGTVHQLAAATGIPVDCIIYSDYVRQDGLTSDYHAGLSAVRTCDKKWRVTHLAPKYHGNIPYWHGVIAGYWLTGGLDRNT